MEPTHLSRRSFLALSTMAAAGVTLKPAFEESRDLAYLTLKEASELVRSKTVSPVELTSTCLKPRKLTATIQEIKLPEASIPIDEIYAKVRSVEAYTYHRQWISESPNKYQAVTRQRIIQNAADVKTSDYVQARLQLDLLRRQVNKVFAVVDLLAMPTLPSLPVLIADGANPTAVSIRNTAPFDVLGLPAITVPCGFTASNLPIGLQIVCAPFMESTVLALAHAYEKETEWYKRHPTL